MAYGDLIRVLTGEASREGAALLARAGAEAERIEAEAAAAAARARTALLERQAAEAGERRRQALAAEAEARDGRVVAERRRLLDALREEAAHRLPAACGPDTLARLLDELLAAAPAVPSRLVVDPGAEAQVRELLRSRPPGAAGRVTVETAPAARGGLLLVAGHLLLDDTLPARLERAWPALEPALARLLFAEDP